MPAFQCMTIADTMSIMRAHLAERMKLKTRCARSRYHKVDDACLLPLIRSRFHQLLYPVKKPRVQWSGRGFRQNLQAEVCLCS